MDAQTHAQLQQMDPQQRALFLQHIQKRQLHHLQRQLQVCQNAEYNDTVVNVFYQLLTEGYIILIGFIVLCL